MFKFTAGWIRHYV